MKAPNGHPTCQTTQPHFPGCPPTLHTLSHTQAESSQMFPISTVGLNKSNYRRISCNHSRTIYTAGFCSSNCCPSVAQYFNSLTDSLPRNSNKKKRKLLPVPESLAGLCVLLAAFHLLALSCMLSCWIVSLQHGSSELLWPARSLMCDAVRICPPTPPHPLGATCSTPPPTPPPLSPGRQ